MIKKIVYSFRIEKTMMRNMLQNVTQEKEILIYKGIIYAIDIHRKATESVYILQNLYNIINISLFLKVFPRINNKFCWIILFFNSDWYGLLKQHSCSSKFYFLIKYISL